MKTHIPNQRIFRSALFKNGAWGISANVLQTLFVSLLFIITARQYSSDDFAQFLIASTVYQILVAFSSMGLGMWFIREYKLEADKSKFSSKFIKIQIVLGITFYLANIALAFWLYPNGQIRWLCIILGLNIIFDNVIYAVKNLNIAEFEQKKTFNVLVLDGLLRLLLGCSLLFIPFSIITLSLLLISIRFVTVNLFIKIGSSNNLTLQSILLSTINWTDLKIQLLSNYKFAIIGSVTVIYWRIANVIIAKILTLQDVSDYEISFKILSILMMFPTIAAATIYSEFTKHTNSASRKPIKSLFKILQLGYSGYSIVCFILIYTFADTILLTAFGDKYATSIESLRQMVLVILVFPNVLLQANLIVAMKQEKLDMWLNILSLGAYLTASWIGLTYVKSLSVLNYSIFFSFVLIHILQSIFLIKHNLSKVSDSVVFYLTLISFSAGYPIIIENYNKYTVIVILLISATSILIAIFLQHKKAIKKTNNVEKIHQ